MSGFGKQVPRAVGSGSGPQRSPSSAVAPSPSSAKNAPCKASDRDTQFERKTFVVPARHDKRFGLGIVNSNNQVRVSTIVPDSIASEFFAVKDRVVAINGVQVADKTHCRQLILSACSSAPDFEIVVDRPKKIERVKMAPEQPVVEIPDLSFTRPLKRDPESERGNPWDGFQYAPPDVREILQRRIRQIVCDFLPPYRRNVNARYENVTPVNVDEQAQLTAIASDVPPDKPLMKPRK